MMNTIHNELACDTMGRMEDGCIQLTITSPPYDKLRKYDTNIGHKWDFEMFKSVAKCLYRVTCEGGVVVWVVGDATEKGSETGTSFKQALYFKELGFNLHDTMIYKTNKPPLSHKRYEQCWEYMFIFSKGKPRVFNGLREDCLNAGSKRTATMRQDSDELSSRSAKGKVKKTKLLNNIWYLPRGHRKDNLKISHPATFPDELARRHIVTWTNEGDTVYDPMGGSGTVILEAEKNNRLWVTSDISKSYCELMEERIMKISK